MSANTVNLVIEFQNTEKLAEFVEDLRDHDVFPTRKVAVYQYDGLDHVSPTNSYILKREGDRPEEFRLTVTTETKETRTV